jgi:S-adenosylmethionine decarboxylase
VILKTCGTTINLLGLTRIIEIAREYCGFEHVHRCFYSRKSFFFPERQVGPHVFSESWVVGGDAQVEIDMD